MPTDEAAAKNHQAAMTAAIKELENECVRQLDGIDATHVSGDDEAEIVVGMLALINGMTTLSRTVRGALERFQARVSAARAKK